MKKMSTFYRDDEEYEILRAIMHLNLEKLAYGHSKDKICITKDSLKVIQQTNSYKKIKEVYDAARATCADWER